MRELLQSIKYTKAEQAITEEGTRFVMSTFVFVDSGHDIYSLSKKVSVEEKYLHKEIRRRYPSRHVEEWFKKNGKSGPLVDPS